MQQRNLASDWAHRERASWAQEGSRVEVQRAKETRTFDVKPGGFSD